MNWHIVVTKVSSEELVSLQLKNANFNVFYPKIKKYYPKLKKEKIIPLFSRYIFVQFDYVKDYKLITYTRGVSNILCFLGLPAVVNNIIIEYLKAYCDNTNIITPKYLQTESINVGDEIKITSGVFEGLKGIVSGLYDNKKRIEILIDLIKVRIDKNYLSKIKSQKTSIHK